MNQATPPPLRLNLMFYIRYYLSSWLIRAGLVALPNSRYKTDLTALIYGFKQHVIDTVAADSATPQKPITDPKKALLQSTICDVESAIVFAHNGDATAVLRCLELIEAQLKEAGIINLESKL